MHIGIDARLTYYAGGGISQYIRYLIRSLAETDHRNDYTILLSRKDARSRQRPLVENFHTRSLWTPSHHKWERWTLSAELVRHQLDVVHSPDFIPPAFGARCRIITVHDLNFLYYPEFLTPESHRYYSGQIEWAVKEANHISADSEHTRRDLIDKLSVEPEKITTVHLAANPMYEGGLSEQSMVRTLRKYKLSAGFILFVGTLSPRKNIPTLITVYEQLVVKAGMNPQLVIVGGKGWLYDDIFAAISNSSKASDIIHFNHVSDTELAHFYSAAGALVLPSYYEGFGLPPLEAMHCGCPVIVSSRSSLPEVVGSAGIKLDPDDVEGWVEALTSVLDDSQLRERMIVAGHDQARRFSWGRTATETMELYERCQES